MNFRKIYRKLHLWIGLPGAVLFFFICITGSIFVFADEIMELADSKLLTVSEAWGPRVSAEQMIKVVETAYPGHRLGNMVVYKDAHRNVKFLVFNKDGLTNVFVNPYTGHIAGASRVIQFFYVVAHLHSMLLWHGVGGWIVKIATILFFIALISGLILWWPRNINRKSARNALTFQPGTPVKRLTNDMHRVLGFYGTGILLVITVTGLILAFEPLSNVVSRSVGGDPGRGYETQFPADSLRQAVPMGPVVDGFLSRPGVGQVRVGLYSLEKSALYLLNSAEEIGILTHRGDVHLIDQYTGKEVKNKPASIHWETINVLMRLHTGKWLGWAGEIITFLAGLLGAFLSATGVMIWWLKRK